MFDIVFLDNFSWNVYLSSHDEHKLLFWAQINAQIQHYYPASRLASMFPR